MPLREDLLQPIPGSNPAGANLRYDPIYDKIKEARREEEDVDQGDWKRTRKVADWPLVIKLSGEALATKSKICRSPPGSPRRCSSRSRWADCGPASNSCAACWRNSGS